MPTNLCETNDKFYDDKISHVIPALIKKFLVAKNKLKKVEIWGTGNPKREFLFADDCAMQYILL